MTVENVLNIFFLFFVHYYDRAPVFVDIASLLFQRVLYLYSIIYTLSIDQSIKNQSTMVRSQAHSMSPSPRAKDLEAASLMTALPPPSSSATHGNVVNRLVTRSRIGLSSMIQEDRKTLLMVIASVLIVIIGKCISFAIICNDGFFEVFLIDDRKIKVAGVLYSHPQTPFLFCIIGCLFCAQTKSLQ